MSARIRRWFGCPTCRTIRMSPSRRCVMAGRWNRALWWCTSPPAPRQCGERSIPRPLTPSNLSADATWPRGHMRCISRRRSCPWSSRPPARRPWEKSRRGPSPTWHGWNPAGTVGCRWRPKSRRLTRRPRETKPPMWRWPAMGAPRGRVPSTARFRRRRSSARRRTPSACTVHVVDASIIGAHRRRVQETLYRGIKGPTSHLVNRHALNWIVEGLRRLPRRVGGPHHWVVRQSSHLAAVPL